MDLSVHWMWLLAGALGVVFWPGPCNSLPQRLWLAKDLRKSVTKKKHPWLYDRALRNQPGIAAGEIVAVCWKKQMLAYGFHDPTSPLRVRLLWWPEDGPPMPGDPSWAQDIARRAAARLPIIIDAFGEAGYKLSGVINKDGTETLWGTAPSKEASSFEENGVMYEVDVWHGHKTGFFLDQRPNRLRLRELAAGKDVLDLFSYTGGFAVAAALGGARRCFAVDAARKAVEACERNFRLNGLHAQVSSGTEQFQTTQNMIHLADCWEFLRNAAEAKDAFDIVVCDPPSMAPRVSARPQALKAYNSLNQGALKVLRPGGRLISCSCSSHITRKDLLNTVQEAAQLLGRSVVLEEEGSAGADHPTRRGFPEGEYLQAYLPPRTRLCYHFIRGCCRWEHNCRRHHPHERQLAEISQLLRMVPCRWGSQCRMKNCVFKHEDPEWQRAEDPEVQEQQRAESDESSAESIAWASSREGSTSASTTEDESSASDDEEMSRSRQQFLQSKANPVLIFQDAGICIISKPAGWSADHCPVSRGPDGRPLSLKALHSSGSIEPLSRHPASPVGSWRPFLAPGPTVSGLALMTQTEGAPRRRLARAFRTGRLASYSLALVEGKLDPQRSSAAARCESGLLEVLALAGLERRCSETWGSEASCEHFTLLLVKVLFREDVSLPLPTGAALLQRLNCSSLDQLLLGGRSITGEIQPKDGDEEVTLTLVRVRCNLLEGLAEDLVRSLTCTNALELPPGYLKQEDCLSLVKSVTVRNSGWYFWEHTVSSHVLLLQDGSIFTKQSSSVVNGKTGKQIHCHSIAEGRFEPILTTPGELLVTWTSAAEIEVKGPLKAAPDFAKATWERRNVLDVLPTALQTGTGHLDLQQLCYKWPQSQQAHASLVMPCNMNTNRIEHKRSNNTTAGCSRGTSHCLAAAMKENVGAACKTITIVTRRGLLPMAWGRAALGDSNGPTEGRTEQWFGGRPFFHGLATALSDPWWWADTTYPAVMVYPLPDDLRHALSQLEVSSGSSLTETGPLCTSSQAEEHLHPAMSFVSIGCAVQKALMKKGLLPAELTAALGVPPDCGAVAPAVVPEPSPYGMPRFVRDRWKNDVPKGRWLSSFLQQALAAADKYELNVLEGGWVFVLDLFRRFPQLHEASFGTAHALVRLLGKDPTRALEAKLRRSQIVMRLVEAPERLQAFVEAYASRLAPESHLE
ncbi:rlmI, partial [Symbiodinium sp. CCMP2456]